MRNLLAGLTREKGAAAIDSAYGVYSSGWGSHPDQAVVKKTVADIETDFLFLVPTQIALQLHADNSRSASTGPKTCFNVFAMLISVKSFENEPLYLIKYYNVLIEYSTNGMLKEESQKSFTSSCCFEPPVEPTRTRTCSIWRPASQGSLNGWRRSTPKTYSISLVNLSPPRWSTFRDTET